MTVVSQNAKFKFWPQAWTVSEDPVDWICLHVCYGKREREQESCTKILPSLILRFSCVNGRTCARQVARLRSHLEQIKRDDRMIKAEGLEALSEDELRQACRARGMRAPFGEGAVVFMRKQLKEWLDLSLNRCA